MPPDDPNWLAHLARNVLHDELEDSPFLTPDAADLVRKVSVVFEHSLNFSHIQRAVVTQAPKI